MRSAGNGAAAAAAAAMFSEVCRANTRANTPRVNTHAQHIAPRASQTRSFHVSNNLLGAEKHNFLGLVPVTPSLCTLQIGRPVIVEVGKNAVLRNFGAQHAKNVNKGTDGQESCAEEWTRHAVHANEELASEAASNILRGFLVWLRRLIVPCPGGFPGSRDG